MLAQLREKIQTLANAEKALLAKRFFKMKEGEYGAHDHFIGIAVPQLHLLAKEYHILALTDVSLLLQSKIHEERQLALFILVDRFRKKGSAEKEVIYHFYLNHLPYINNWNLVDASAPAIMGGFLHGQDLTELFRLCATTDLWLKRIAIVATLYFIRHNQFDPTLQIAVDYFDDRRDLLHKATGWMLREVGKKDIGVLTSFLDANFRKMPPIMVRYAVEKMAPEERVKYSVKNRLI